jgi:hypothetical protein
MVTNSRSTTLGADIVTERKLPRVLADPPAWAVMLACAIALSLRRAGAISNPQLWAEDGRLFGDAYALGGHSILVPFSGYLHVLPRLAAWLALACGPVYARWFFVGSAYVTTLYVASRALSVRCPLPRLLGIGALAVVLVPDTYEVLLNLVNLQWVTGAGLLLLLISSDPAGLGEWIHDLLAGAIIGLTGPFSVFFFPLFIMRAIRRKTPASWCILALVGACAVAQAAVFLSQPAEILPKTMDDVSFSLVLPAIARRVGASILLGSIGGSDADLYVGTVAGIATVAGAAFLAWRLGQNRMERLSLGAAIVILLVFSFYRQRFVLDRFFRPPYASRYFYIPQLIFIWLLLWSAVLRNRLGRIAATLLVVAFVLNLPRLREPPYLDTRWSTYEQSMREGRKILIPINPPGWYIQLPGRTPSPESGAGR